MNLDRDLTILLTLKDRAAYTFRWMAYAEQIRLPFKVLIADGGADESVPQALADRTRFPNVDYEYLRFSYDASYLDYYAKIVGALDQVRTPYVVMADNDDFFVANGLRRAVEFLATHSDYVACGGQSAIFWLDSTSDGSNPAPYGKGIHWKCANDLRSIDGDSAVARVQEQAQSGADSFYDVKRTAEAKKEFTLVRELGLNDLLLMEILVVFLCTIAGKTKRLKCSHLVRQHNAPQSSGGEHQRRYGDWFGRMLIESWSGEFAKFLTATAASLSAKDGVPTEVAREHIRSAYRMAIAPALLSDLLDEPTVTPSMVVWIAVVRGLVRLPEGSLLRNLFRQLYRRARWISASAVYGMDMVARPNRNASADIAPIRDFLIRKI
jgi:glycosyltransferase domain-containing protein